MNKKISNLSDSEFGLPEKRKYPLHDREHVMSAIRFFNYIDEADEKELAQNIIAKMKKYGMPPTTVGEKNRLKKYINSQDIEESSTLSTAAKSVKFMLKMKKYERTTGITGAHGYASLIQMHGYNKVFMAMVQEETDIEFLKYLRADTSTARYTIQIIRDRIDKCKELGYCKETKPYYDNLYKMYISKGITSTDCELTLEGFQRMMSEITDRIKYLRKQQKEVKEDATGNAIMGTMENPDSIYIINYFKRNSFSGELEEHQGICRKDMKNIHIYSDAKKGLIPKSLDEFNNLIEGQISLYATSNTDIMNIIENVTSEQEIQYYSYQTPALVCESTNLNMREVPIDLTINLLQELQLYADAEKRALDEHRYLNLCAVPVIESYDPHRSYNYYTDVAGYFIKNELSKTRSASYNSIDEIPIFICDYIRMLR